MPKEPPKALTPPLVVGITGASGVVYGAVLATVLGGLGVPFDLIVSQQARRNMELEDLAPSLRGFAALARHTYAPEDMAAPPASGSFPTRGMIIAPCSIGTLSAVASSRNETLLHRAADVTLKERRPLVLGVRETPLHIGHLRLMLQAAEAGAIIAPPLPAFYHKPRTLEDIVSQSVGKWLSLVGIAARLFPPWGLED